MNRKGFTLMEMVITIMILSVAIGITSFGLSIVFRGRVDGAARELHTDLIDARFRTTAEPDIAYQVEFFYNSGGGTYGYDVIKWDLDAGVEISRESIDLSPSLVLSKYNTSNGTFEPLDTISATFPDAALTLRFNPTTGGLMGTNFAGNSISGQGTYQLSTDRNSKTYTFEVVELTGRVILNE